MKRVTRWYPDTCNCVIEYEWDDEEDENTRKHYFKAVVHICDEHKRLGLKGKDLFDQVLSENIRKNMVWNMLKERLNLSDDDITEYEWWFDERRNLHVRIRRGMKNEIRKSVQEECDRKFGVGKVVVH